MTCGYASAAVVTSRQIDRLGRLLGVARRDSRFYRDTLPGASPGRASLQGLPVVSKHELMANFDDWVTDPELKLSEISRFITANPARIAEPYLGKYLLWESSGTSH